MLVVGEVRHSLDILNMGVLTKQSQIPNHEGQREHQHLHSITCHLGILLAINVNVVEVDRICIQQCTSMYLVHTSTYQVQRSTYMYIPLVQFVLGGRHEELKEGYQLPSVVLKQPVP